MGKCEKLKKDHEFRKVYKLGKSFTTKHIVLYVYYNNSKKKRAGFVVSKKIGKAVVRNRIKRIFREVYRLSHTKLIYGIDVIFIARQNITKLNFHRIRKEMYRLYEMADIFKSR